MSPSSVTFDCTQCGRCCHGLRLPLAIEEAIDWIDRGGRVELLCDAGPPSQGDDHGPSRASYQAVRSFPGVSGAVTVQVSVTLVASFSGPCPFLLPDMRCGNYTARPRVCRVYPAEANPFVRLDPAAKACPTEAWDSALTVLVRDDRVVDPAIRDAIGGMRRAGAEDAAAKALICQQLGIDVAAFANEGLAVHAPDQPLLRQALERSSLTRATANDPAVWRMSTNRSATAAMLISAGCAVVDADDAYIGFFPGDL